MNPYSDKKVRGYVRAFLDEYFSDNRKRVLVFGINPGRFGAGITGVTFTDPVTLADNCGIVNDLPRRQELSSIFIYELIERCGGPREFCRHFFLTAVSPLGFTRNGNNLNYYDDRILLNAVEPFVIKTIGQQIALGGRSECAVVLGVENARFVRLLNDKYGFFGEVHALEHPRYIMQYQRPQREKYLAKYQKVLSSCQNGWRSPASKRSRPHPVPPIHSDMARHARLIEQIVRGQSDANIRFDQLRSLLRALGFEEKIRGSHHLFRRAGIVERINLQQVEGKAKIYQIWQIRAILMKYHWDALRDVEKP